MITLINTQARMYRRYGSTAVAHVCLWSNRVV